MHTSEFCNMVSRREKIAQRVQALIENDDEDVIDFKTFLSGLAPTSNQFKKIKDRLFDNKPKTYIQIMYKLLETHACFPHPQIPLLM